MVPHDQETVSRDRVEDFQRARIVSAMVEVASELGYLGAAVAPVVARAGVSRRTFYELFDGREDCFLAAFDWGVRQAHETMLEAYASQHSWRDRVRCALAALLRMLDLEPELARLCVIEALGAGRLVLARRTQISDELVAALEAKAPRPRGGTSALPLLTAEGVVGGAFSVIHGRLLDPDAGPLIELHGQLMALIALPYLGPSAAGEELTRSAPETPPREIASARADRGGGRLLEKLDMRLTYRTVRCLVFIAEHPGSSNREVARGGEIPDEGQASKLLARLVKLDLIANSRSPGPGFPNRWTLTEHGQQVLGAVQRR
ncbi:MAG TPA: TetR family transcriptional regulator [Solirubrobacteraceae bacterium]|jgi:AcrR family transcriptional regulator/DNA-binding MarR family transcriptional regulator|nr:TetR family transcriptional regulator [Solirubrobacteraceae bacterium]